MKCATSVGTCWSIGGGPAGAAAGYWLADAGHRVLVVEKKQFPREKTCGDGLTPRAVRQLHDMGLAGQLSGSLRYDGLRSIAHGVTLELEWPEHPDFPDYGYVVRRRDLDEMVAGAAAGAGATVWTGRRGGRAAGRGRPGAWRGRPARRWHRSRCGPATSSSPTAPTPVSGGRWARPATATYPLGMAVRGYFTSPFHDEPWIESHLDLRDRDGNHLPGLRLDLPGGRRHGERRRRPAVDVLGMEVDQHQRADGRVRRATAPARWGISPGDVVRGAHRRQAARPADRSRRTSGPRGWSSATPPARSTRSTARASRSRTRPGAWPRARCPPR